ncbi:efflux RND transporter periplasmic adaptor subunit [Shewanella sedimentimangrovi]|uniref:Efflux RND transporter periplasmic adaptor subunit n=1 Tax=Shewanella sedimentimangrovi TaxID=2814293 RepID=A0ABX7R350_9GAMM|nr:efflux RND transporter periplasmic adaptor subunit [Shewanella sedimentimangrovi]QSX38236.1 efflux RND transporter periplasmic adaptor subunit [Shewanella sedimentimangrovi]
MSHKLQLRFAGVALAALWLLAGCGQSQAEGAQAPAAPSVDVAQVLEESITEWDEFTGRLQAPEQVLLIPRVSGYLQGVRFREGALVKQGEVLFQIESAPFEAEVARLKAELASAESAEVLARNDYARAEQLFASKAVSAELLDGRLAQKRQAAANVASVKAALVRAELDLSYTQVKAPISGRVSIANVTAGNYVSAGQTELTRLVSTDNMYAYFDVDEQTYLKYAALSRARQLQDPRAGGNPVFMSLVNESSFGHQGQIDFVDNSLNAQTGTIRVRASFDNSDGALLPGLFAKVRLAGSKRYQGILVDDKAIGTDLGSKYVLLLDENNSLVYRQVQLGEKVAGLRIIRSGLTAGDRIVVNGLQRVRPTMQVQPNMVEMAAEEIIENLRRQQAGLFADSPELAKSSELANSPELAKSLEHVNSPELAGSLEPAVNRKTALSPTALNK